MAWQDADNYLHVYGRDETATLCAVHQTGWDTGDLYGRVVPVWDSHESPVPGGGQSLTTRPLVGQVDRYAVDAFPDFMPNQHVMHQGVPPGEACAIYTQSVRTSFWCVEKMRMVDPAALPKPYTVPRYQTSLTVKNAFGAPIGGVGVQISADVPVDLEVAGTFYRTGAVSPVTLVTDVRGQVTLRVVAAGLTVPDLYVTVPGLDQSATIQMAADVHKFLAGNATLPNHPDGFTAKVVEKATIPGSTTKLFPHLAPTGSQGTWPPQAADVVAWCQGAFAVDTGQPLPTAMTAGLAEGEQVLAFTIQTHDPTRSGFEVYTNSDQINAREASLDALDGFITEAEDWLGDVWQGIRHGVTEVSEVLVDLADSTIELVITLVDGVINRLKVAWDDILSAAHAVEAVFVAIGAKIQEALQWLKWAFDFKDAFLTAKALGQALGQLPTLLTPCSPSGSTSPTTSSSTETTRSTTAIEGAKAGLAGPRPSARWMPPAPPPGLSIPASGNAVTDQAQGPHANWLTGKVTGDRALRAALVSFDEAVGPMDELFATSGNADRQPRRPSAPHRRRATTSATCSATCSTAGTPRPWPPVRSGWCSTCSSTWHRGGARVRRRRRGRRHRLGPYLPRPDGAACSSTPLDGVPLARPVVGLHGRQSRPGHQGSSAHRRVARDAPGRLPHHHPLQDDHGRRTLPRRQLPAELASHGGSVALPADQAQDILRLHAFIGIYRLSDLFFYPVLDYLCLVPTAPGLMAGRIHAYRRTCTAR